MEKTASALNKGFASATFIKLIAVVSMTIDHIGALGFEIPAVAAHLDILRLIGRIAAPLFLYFVVESVKFTKDKRRFLLRLYVAAVCTGLCNMLVSIFLFDSAQGFGNIFHSFVWVVGSIILIELIVDKCREKKWSAAILYSGCMVLVIGVTLLMEKAIVNYEAVAQLFGTNIPGAQTIHEVFRALVRSPRSIEYSALFIALGVAWYFLKTKYQRCAVLAFLCAISFFTGFTTVPYLEFISGTQWAMVGAIPAILIYNGKRGCGSKWFFYIYYPVHAYVLAFAARFLAG